MHAKRDAQGAPVGHPTRHHAPRDIHEPRHDTRPAVLTLILSALATYGWLAHMIWSMT